MKKRVLLTIMILFSINVNSVGPECKLPEIKFFEMVNDGGIQKFNFQCFIDSVSGDLATPVTGTIEYLGVKFDREIALGALIDIYESLLLRLIEKAAEASVPLPNFIINADNIEIKGGDLEDKRNNLLSKYEEKIGGVNLEKVKSKIEGATDTKGILDYFIKPKEIKPNWFASWFISPEKYLTSADSEFLNISLNYIYLFALSFLIEDKQDLNKFLSCMWEIYNTVITENLEKNTVDTQVLQVFDAIEKDSNMESIKPAPLSLEKNRACLNLLSSTLTSLANLKLV